MRSLTIALLLAAMTPAATAAMAQPPQGGVAPNAQFSAVQFPTPPDSRIRRDESVVVGAGSTWFGMLVLDSGSSLEEVQQFYSRTMPAQGWKPLSAFVSQVIALQYLDESRSRSLTITIRKKAALGRGAVVEVLVSPILQQ